MSSVLGAGTRTIPTPVYNIDRRELRAHFSDDGQLEHGRLRYQAVLAVLPSAVPIPALAAVGVLRAHPRPRLVDAAVAVGLEVLAGVPVDRRLVHVAIATDGALALVD